MLSCRIQDEVAKKKESQNVVTHSKESCVGRGMVLHVFDSSPQMADAGGIPEFKTGL